MRRVLLFASLSLLVAFGHVQAEELERVVFTTAPTHSEEETRRLYTLLMDYLSRVTGKEFVIDTADNFIQYAIRMRLDKYDMLFDGPHLVGWRMAHLNNTPLVRLPGTIRIVVVAREQSRIESMEELKYGQGRVCAFASPNMLTMAFLSYFPNPVRQPMMLRVQGFKELERCVRSGRGDVAVLRDKLWNKMDQTGLKVVAAPQRGYPERTFSVSSRLDAALQQKIRDALLSEEGMQASQPILKRFKKDKLLAANAEAYHGLDQLLSPIWGFHSRR